ncbi:unnamed protein product, partial [marine sediment metagenome]
ETVDVVWVQRYLARYGEYASQIRPIAPKRVLGG